MVKAKGNTTDKQAADSKKHRKAPEEITEILEVSKGSLECCVIGLPDISLIHNRPSEKARRELLFPWGRKSQIERATSLKHNPVEEFRASPYILRDPKHETLIALRGAAFKGAMRSAALDLPGAKKAQIGRLVRVEGELIGIHGIPILKMDIVRSADMNRTPDVRTRAAMREWACRLRITFIQPLIRAQAVANLLGAAGIIDGVGDGRPEKGALDFGQFRICDRNDPDFKRIVETAGRAAQIEALAHPEPYDDETSELLTWFTEEFSRRKLAGRVGAMETTPAAEEEEAVLQ
jgi:hypothetical protein